MAELKYTYFDGQKAVTVADLGGFMDWLVDQEGGGNSAITVPQAIATVAFVFRAVRLRSQALATLPFEIIQRKGDADSESGDEIFDSSKDYQNKLGYWPDPIDTLTRIEESLCAVGSAYVRKAVNQARYIKGLQYWAPRTIKPEISGEIGLYSFERNVNGAVTHWPVDQVLHWWHPDYRVEVGAPTKSPVKAGLAAAGVLHNSDAVVEAFFGRGAIKALIFAVKGMPDEKERTRLLDWFKRTFSRGVASAFETGIFNAGEVSTVPIGQGLEDMASEALTKEKREDISVTLGIPYSLLLSGSLAGLGSGGVADRDDILFYTKTIKPEAEFIARVLNEQLFHDQGLHFRFRYSDLDVFSEDEKERMAAWKLGVDGGFRPEVAAWMLGMEVPKADDIPLWYAAAFVEKPDPLAMAAQFAPREDSEGGAPPKQESDARERDVGGDEADKAADLGRWLRMATRRFDEGHPEKALAFESEAIPATLNAAIAGALEDAQTADDVRRVFDWAEYP